MRNYTGHGWEGHNFSLSHSTKDIANLLRDFIKKDKELSACKWSVTSDYNSITVALMAAPFNPFSDELLELNKDIAYTQCALQTASPKAKALFERVQGFLISYNYDDSEGMIDYFDRYFYDWYNIGKWDKPFQLIEAKIESKVSSGVKIVSYSDKAVAVIGDTKPLKDTLKELGGKFNSHLSCGAGWIFSKSKLETLESILA